MSLSLYKNAMVMKSRTKKFYIINLVFELKL